jgi:hypothetical protein
MPVKALLVLALIFASGLAAITLLAFGQSNASPIVGKWYFHSSGCWLGCGEYNLSYGFYSPIDVDTGAGFNLSLRVDSLPWSAQSILARDVNLTIVSQNGTWILTKLIAINKTLDNGESWGPRYSNFTFTDSSLQLTPGEEIAASITVSLDYSENAIITGSPYPKHETMTSVAVNLFKPRPANAESSPAVIWNPSIAQVLFVGFLIFAGYEIFARVRGLPRPTQWGSGWRDPATGSFESGSKSWLAWIAFGFVIVFFVLNQFGVPNYLTSMGQVSIGALTGNPDLAAALVVLAFGIGVLAKARGFRRVS